ncbi:hypothetical protein CDAR_423021 [Caerostris darwini]|uniref:Uncharacterized protein n=1 Tax=Caerostris darwini TaxID=1538125 RepID=A0AAV4TFH9_9ARAC|nr:hypothetical protein CDAR_423021 [Caerostris darwini]
MQQRWTLKKSPLLICGLGLNEREPGLLLGDTENPANTDTPLALLTLISETACFFVSSIVPPAQQQTPGVNDSVNNVPGTPPSQRQYVTRPPPTDEGLEHPLYLFNTVAFRIMLAREIRHI